MSYQPKTGQPCHCRKGVQRDNCPDCEGTGMRIDFAAIRATAKQPKEESLYAALVVAGVPIENHESDLYFPATAETQEILSRFPLENGKKISVALFKLEREAHKAMEHYCSEPGGFYSPTFEQTFYFDGQCGANLERYKHQMSKLVAKTLGKLPPGFFVNGDPRGYALKLDPDNSEAKKLIEAVGLHRDFGGYGILSPEITGD